MKRSNRFSSMMYRVRRIFSRRPRDTSAIPAAPSTPPPSFGQDEPGPSRAFAASTPADGHEFSAALRVPGARLVRDPHPHSEDVMSHTDPGTPWRVVTAPQLSDAEYRRLVRRLTNMPPEVQRLLVRLVRAIQRDGRIIVPGRPPTDLN